MAGIYIHIPFCKQRCGYCDFYSHTNLQLKQRYVDTLCKEIELRKHYLAPNETIETLYFGGGTPSLLNTSDFEQIYNALSTHFSLHNLVEITVEVNPDDVNDLLLDTLKSIGCNRLSMGIQSFFDHELTVLGRRHTAQQAIEAVNLAQQHGFSNISIDLMYALPNQTLTTWRETLKLAISMNVQHISAYHLTYEPGTLFYKQKTNKIITEKDEEESIQLYEILIQSLTEAGYNQYEISNFSLPDYESKHNSSYWKNTPYIGLGASAHSYNGASRQWNIASVITYCNHIEENKSFFEIEFLTEKEKYNDFIITSLRTSKGVDLQKLTTLFGEKSRSYFIQQCQPYVHTNMLCEKDNFVRLTQKGIFVSDSILETLIDV